MAFETSNPSLETALGHELLAGKIDAEYAYTCLLAYATHSKDLSEGIVIDFPTQLPPAA